MGYTSCMKRALHAHHSVLHRYPASMGERLYALIWGPFLVVLLMLVFTVFHPPAVAAVNVTLPVILLATWYTLVRIMAAYALAVMIAIPLAILAERSRAFEGILLPLFDVFGSIPNLAVFPALIFFFMQFGFSSGAAIVLLMLNMIWNIVFAVVGGLKVIPQDVVYAARVFGLSGFSYFRKLTLPAIFPQFVTGSILAVASGWNIVVVSEVIHNYVPGGLPSQDLFGVGSILVATSAAGATTQYILAFAAMVATIAIFNFFVWQRLLTYAQRFRFD